MRHWVMGAGLFLLLGAFVSGTAAQDNLPIIDMHVHTADGTVQDQVAVMDEFHIVKAFLSGSLEEVYQWTAAAPGRFIASPMFPVFGINGFPDIEALRAEYVAGRLQGMGEITSQYLGIPPNALVLEPYFALAEEQDVPVLIHMAGGGAPYPTFRLSAGRPLLLEEVLVRHPKLRIYVENASYPFLDEMTALMRRYRQQVYADLSTMTRAKQRSVFHNYLRALIQRGLGKQLMFGTDGAPARTPQNIEAIESASFLTDEQKRDIFYNNAARFLRFTDEEIAAHHDR
ncbi:MAG: amidohydrolase family protein [Proteobacteria bacterium]|nr:amidohydrolase family protein [Pseudomonadota bacterium]